MKTEEQFNLVGPCGICCGECECYKAKDSQQLLDYLISRGIKAEKLPCPGCREVEGKCPVIGTVCETYSCAQEHAVDFCYECSDYPCTKVLPMADGAAIYPHNLKTFCLSFIKNKGLDEFVKAYPEIKLKYYKGKMAVGKGPQLD